MDVALTKQQEMARVLFRNFAEKEVKPIAHEIDEEERFPSETVEKMRRYGMMNVPTPRQYGGAGGDYLTYTLLVVFRAYLDVRH